MRKAISRIVERYGMELKSSPLVLVDVGAAGACPKEWEPMANISKIVSFEPRVSSVDITQKGQNVPNSIFLYKALWKERGKMKLFETKGATSSSLIPPNKEILKRFSWHEDFNIAASRELEVEKLDEQLSSAGVKDVDFIKLDTQGSEKYILEGGGAFQGFRCKG